jgi:hypothetical protein
MAFGSYAAIRPDWRLIWKRGSEWHKATSKQKSLALRAESFCVRCEPWIHLLPAGRNLKGSAFSNFAAALPK